MAVKLIVALDFNDKLTADTFIQQLPPEHVAVKVGLELFTTLGPEWVSTLVDQGFKVFLDLKFHDIPNTVARACEAAAKLGVWMINVHALGGSKMMEAAAKALAPFKSHDGPLLIAVTVLTSMNEACFDSIGFERPLSSQVVHLANLAHQAGLDGVVCSGFECEAIKQQCGLDFITVTPGIRLPSDAADDQSRVMTPSLAVNSGSDYIVMGRSITHAPDPYGVILSVLQELQP